MQTSIRSTLILLVAFAAWTAGFSRADSGCNRSLDIEPAKAGGPLQRGLDAVAVVQKVLQHPRCQNCHIPGDAPLQFDEGAPHRMNVLRGADGQGAPGLACATCHDAKNPPASYGEHAPPGAPNWHLPPATQKMVFINLSPAELCATIKDPAKTGGRDLAAMLKHVAEDKLVLWGWNPGGSRAPVDVPHAEFVKAFKDWIDAGAPCPSK
jgi:hypothetical protein